MLQTFLDTVSPIQEWDSEATINTVITTNICTCSSSLSLSEVVAWVLASTLMVLLTGLLSFNVIVLYFYKKRQGRATESGRRKYKMEGNPCYEATDE